ncbi:cytochrome c550 [Bacillus sp. 2205SS5-2]|uniref:cytochrome c550 n=1 Tax=Bacillus sp. 2205SS5-2 TaxID=3109031 RepID=UPI003007C772
MNRNPIIPFILIMVMGIGLVFFLSVKGISDADEMASEHGEGEMEGSEDVAFDPEGLYEKSCIGCHGGDYGGGVGPGLVGVGEKYSAEEIKDILQNGKGAGMPANLVPAENLDAMTEWLLSLE